MTLFFVLSSSLVLDLERKKGFSLSCCVIFLFIFPFIPSHFFEDIMYLILEPIETSFIAESFPVI